MVFTYLSYLNFCDWKSSLFISHLATITKRSYVVSIFLSVQLLVLKQLPMQTFCLSSLFPAFRCYAKGEKAELEHVDECERSQHLSPFIYTIRNRFCAFPYRIPYEMTAETNKYTNTDIQKNGRLWAQGGTGGWGDM